MSEALLDKGYEPHEVEARWYRYWLENKLFAAKDRDGEREAFSIVIPPPNVTGKLHMGHALNNTLQDILCRTLDAGNGPCGHRHPERGGKTAGFRR